MPRMHFSPGRGLLLFAIALLSGTVLTACLNTGPTANEIVARSLEHYESAESYEARATSYMFPRSEDPSGTEIIEVERPDKLRYMGPDRTLRAVVIGEQAYVPSESNPGKWTLAVVENPTSLRLLDRALPARFTRTEITGGDDRFWVIKALGGPASVSDIGLNLVFKYELKIRKTDFALVQLTRWDFPLVDIDENDEFISKIAEGTEDMSHMRRVIEISRYGDNFSIEAPPGSDIVIELSRVWPEDQETRVLLSAEIGFWLSQAVPIMELSVEPSVRLVPTRTDISDERGFSGYSTFFPHLAWESNTTYTATLTWGESESDLNIHTWSFTTR